MSADTYAVLIASKELIFQLKRAFSVTFKYGVLRSRAYRAVMIDRLHSNRL